MDRAGLTEDQDSRYDRFGTDLCSRHWTAGAWTLPGGGRDLGARQPMTGSAIREIREETGRDGPRRWTDSSVSTRWSSRASGG